MPILIHNRMLNSAQTPKLLKSSSLELEEKPEFYPWKSLGQTIGKIEQKCQKPAGREWVSECPKKLEETRVYQYNTNDNKNGEEFAGAIVVPITIQGEFICISVYEQGKGTAKSKKTYTFPGGTAISEEEQKVPGLIALRELFEETGVLMFGKYLDDGKTIFFDTAKLFENSFSFDMNFTSGGENKKKFRIYVIINTEYNIAAIYEDFKAKRQKLSRKHFKQFFETTGVFTIHFKYYLDAYLKQRESISRQQKNNEKIERTKTVIFSKDGNGYVLTSRTSKIIERLFNSTQKLDEFIRRLRKLYNISDLNG